MVIGVTFFIIAALIAIIWVLIELKRFRHKIFAFFLILLILFTYFSFTYSIKDKNVDFKSVSGIIDATKLYFSWLGSLFTNVKGITTHAVQMDWKSSNSTSS